MILAHELSVADRLELVRTPAIPRGVPNPDIAEHNPMGKIPVLLRQGHRPIIESSAICDYLCSLVPDGARLLPVTGEQRIVQLRWEAFSGQLLEVLLSWRIDATGEGGGDPARLESYRAKAECGLLALEQETDDIAHAPFGPGPIGVVCLLGHLDFRFRESDWRKALPALAKFAEQSEGRASVRATAIVNDLGDEGPDLKLRFKEN